MTTQTQHLAFPCRRLPEEPRLARLLGLYPQAQQGLWMQRIRVPAGRLEAGQWRALAELAREYTPATPLHLTTRQDVELHDLRAEQIPAVQHILAAAGLTGLGACGDTARNVTVCTCSGVRGESPELEPLAGQIRELLAGLPDIFALPRKFKVSLSACHKGCAGPWLNDLGLVAGHEGGAWSFAVTVAGSLGARPGLGMLLFEQLAPQDVLPLVLAAVRLFAAHGDRQNRATARLRHVRQRMGDEPFTALLLEGFAAARAERLWPAVQLETSARQLPARRVLSFPNGDLTPEQAQALAELAAQPDLAVRVGTYHQVRVFGATPEALDAALAAREALDEPRRPQPTVVACPGKRWCARGLADTNALAGAIRAELGRLLPPEMLVAVSGCPNGCVHSAVAEVGLTGMLTSRHGVRREAFALATGGGRGRNDRLAQLQARALLPEEVLAELHKRLGAAER